ncbi:hypothetical protein C0585_04530 [Candidatus Woesearchaeota archaeon]|nr:MAG: hypothetical protein C0585_04530 [Candidatus Woesearchaeota archaeon]
MSLDNFDIFEIANEDLEKILGSEYPHVIMENVNEINFPNLLTSIFNKITKFGVYISEGSLKYNHNLNQPEKIYLSRDDSYFKSLSDEEKKNLSSRLVFFEDYDSKINKQRKSFVIIDSPIILGGCEIGFEVFKYDDSKKEFEFINFVEREKYKTMKPNSRNNSYEFNIGKGEHDLRIALNPDSKLYLLR